MTPQYNLSASWARTVGGDGGTKRGGLVTCPAGEAEGFHPRPLGLRADAAGDCGNPGRLPERARGYEVGLRFGTTQGWFLDVAAFRRDSSNLIDFVSCPAGPAPQPPICAGGYRPFGTYDNINPARAEGIEVEGGVRLHDRF